MKVPLIVLDKSWLQGHSKEDVISLTANNRLLVTDMLFYELTTTNDNVSMKRCFEKLIESVNYCDFIENVGGLLRYEMKNNLPCTPFTGKPFLHNANRFTNIFEGIITNGFSEYQEKCKIEERKEREINEAEMFKMMFASVGVWFPALYKTKGSSDIEYQSICEQIVTDSNKIKSIYAELIKLRKNCYTPVDNINENWTFYRWMQVYLLAAIEYCQKYGVDNAAVISKKLPNEFLDLEYLITATLADGFATSERRLQNLYKLLCPNGILIQ